MKYLNSLLLLFMLLNLTSCSSETDVSNQPFAQNLIGKCLEVKQDLFLYQWPNQDDYYIQLPGELVGAYLPISIEDYIEHPNDWWKTELYLKRIHGDSPERYMQAQVIGVVTKGTKLLVKKVVFVKRPSIKYNKCYVEILNGAFKNKISKIDLVQFYPLPSSENFKLDERALKFCEEQKSTSSNSSEESLIHRD